jgi:hypothetical protein
VTDLHLERKKAYDMAKKDFEELIKQVKETYDDMLRNKDTQTVRVCHTCAIGALENLLDLVPNLRLE